MASDFKQLLLQHQDIFAKSSTDIWFCDLLEHDVDTADAAAIRQPPRRPPLASGTAEDDLIYEMLAADVIKPSTSPWASPVCLTKKPDGCFSPQGRGPGFRSGHTYLGPGPELHNPADT